MVTYRPQRYTSPHPTVPVWPPGLGPYRFLKPIKLGDVSLEVADGKNCQCASRHQAGASRLRRISRTSSILPHCSQRYWIMSVPEDSGVELAIFIVTLHIMQVRRSISGLLSSFALFTSPSAPARPAGGWVWVRSAIGRAQHMSDSKVRHTRSQSRLKPFRLLCCHLWKPGCSGQGLQKSRRR